MDMISLIHLTDMKINKTTHRSIYDTYGYYPSEVSITKIHSLTGWNKMLQFVKDNNYVIELKIFDK
jgi:hypothetical protein